jgi:hypothetical protein
MQPSKSYFIFGAKVSIAGIVVCPSSLSALAGNASVKSCVNVNKTEIILSISKLFTSRISVKRFLLD